MWKLLAWVVEGERIIGCACRIIANYNTLQYNTTQHNTIQYTAKTLTSLSVPFTPACSGVFVYADFSKFLPDDSWEGEEALVQMFFNEGVVMTPGKSQQAAKPGFFRICYAWVDVVVLEIAMGRIRTVADNLNLNGWVDLDSET